MAATPPLQLQTPHTIPITSSPTTTTTTWCLKESPAKTESQGKMYVALPLRCTTLKRNSFRRAPIASSPNSANLNTPIPITSSPTTTRTTQDRKKAPTKIESEGKIHVSLQLQSAALKGNSFRRAPIASFPKPEDPNTPISLLSLSKTLQEAHQIHTLLIKSSQISHPFSANRLAEFYAINGALHCAETIINSLNKPNTFSFNTLINGNLRIQQPRNAILVYQEMLLRFVHPDAFTFSLILKGCGELRDLGVVRQFHSHVVKSGFDDCVYVGNKLIHVYGVCGSVADAQKVFDEMSKRDVVTWNSMLDGYVECGDGEGVRELFDKMPQRDVASWNIVIGYYVKVGEFKNAIDTFYGVGMEGELPDRVTLISVLTAVAHLGALDQGKWVHALIGKSRIELNENLGSALINMYAKCGDVEGAIDTFYKVKKKNVDTWNALISGLAVNGQSGKALEFFSLMEGSSVRADAISFSSVLNACSHGGLVEEGLMLFNKMKSVYGVEPDIVHYGCLVDLLGRAGLFDKVKKILETMPLEPDAVIWKALLGACRIRKNLDLGEEAGLRLIQLAPDDHAGYVMLSNIYALAGKWTEVYKARKKMKERGVRKPPGCSSIEVDGVIHEFISGDIIHHRKHQIYEMLDEMVKRLKMAGYEPDTEQVLLDIDEEDMKRVSLYRHSERLAVAFGLINTSRGRTIRVVKNLRMCSDCHTVFKLLSTIYERSIVVRDPNRFHHFSEGSCSCKDYW